MKSGSFLRKQFEPNFEFVQPLYEKPKAKNKHKNNVLSIGFDRKLKLDGSGQQHKDIRNKYTWRNECDLRNVEIGIPGSIEHRSIFYEETVSPRVITYSKSKRNLLKTSNNLQKKYNVQQMIGCSKDMNKDTEIEDLKAKITIVHKLPASWLRLFPAPTFPGETFSSVLFRTLVSQFGLEALLVLWTTAWVFIINSFEETHERTVSKEFVKEQNQLIVDLATELRQIIPVSPKWRESIERRIIEERQLTIRGVGSGARLDGGKYWDLPGTFLFTVYVMTALGFGAPVPYTLCGRISAIIYACVAVPTHIFLMVNSSTFAVVQIENFLLKRNQRKRKVSEENTQKIRKQTNKGEVELSSNNNDNWNQNICRRIMKKCISIICIARCIPLVGLLYYILGAISFGVLRSKATHETALFPLEFTTSGGLELVSGPVRIIYGFYVEGAMCLLSCGLATLRRHIADGISSTTEKYRLFDSEMCDECIELDSITQKEIDLQ